MTEFDSFNPRPQAKYRPDHAPALPGIVEDSSTADFVAQVALGDVLRYPSRSLAKQMLDLSEGRSYELQGEALQRARALIEHTIGTTLRTGKHNEVTPTLIDRLSFSWRLMQQADAAVRRPAKSDVPTPTTLSYAHALFAPLLPGGMRIPLVQALLEMLRLDDDAKFVHAYYLFRRAKSPNSTDLARPLSSALRTGNDDNVRRVIWWCLRARREQYVEVPPNETVRIHYKYLVETVVEDAAGWFDLDDSTRVLAPHVEAEVDRWLTYSGLLDTSEAGSPTGEVDRDLARAFLRHNELKTKLKIWARPAASGSSHEAELETQLRQYVAENQSLEERLRALQGASQLNDNPAPSGSADLARLTEVLKTIDAKYAFDNLNAVQLGDETYLTLRSFVSHLFYSLRKQGFTEYPEQTEFVLTYDESGLYDCDGFEVAPGENVPVVVTRKGWALRAKNRLSPIRRAHLSQSNRAGGVD